MNPSQDKSSDAAGLHELPFDDEISERLRSVKNPAERRTIARLLRALTVLPIEQTRAALETSALIAAVSLRASIEFLRAVPDAAQVLEPAELRAWGELGRRLTMTDVETGVSFFTSGIGEFEKVPSLARPFVFQVCARQMILSANTAAETFRNAPSLAQAVGDAELLRAIYEVAASISRRSAKHSAEFLNATPNVVAALGAEGVGDRVSGVGTNDSLKSEPLHPEPYTQNPSGIGDTGIVGTAKKQERTQHLPPTPYPQHPIPHALPPELLVEAIDLVKAFAEHAGGIGADAWASLPSALERLTREQSRLLLKRSASFLERGGAVAYHFLIAGGDVLRALPECFEDWIELLRTITPHGNAALVAFIRASPRFFQNVSITKNHLGSAALVQRVIGLTRDVAQIDSEAALACLRSSAKALHTVSIEQFESWARAGLISGDARARRSYYALETRSSNEALRAGEAGVSLESIQTLLRLYV